MASKRVLKLYGRVFLRGAIRAVTGLHIGAEYSDLVIGGVDNPVIRNPMDNRPYIPGSSLKGKLRSLAEKMTGADLNENIGTHRNQVSIHIGKSLQEYRKYWVNPVFGVPSNLKYQVPAPTRLVVRDVFLEQNSAVELDLLRTDQPYTEIKTEVAIDRITSKANPRPMERVPAGALFGPFEIVYTVYERPDVDIFGEFLETLQFLEDDYLGGVGSRGSGQIRFENLSVTMRSTTNYAFAESFIDDQYLMIQGLLDLREDLKNWIVPRLFNSTDSQTDEQDY